MTDAAIAPLAPAVAAGRLKLGSPEHLRLFCETLLTTHNPYKPAIIDWPRLDPETQAKITGLPIWDIAVQTEGKAGLRVRTAWRGRCPVRNQAAHAASRDGTEEKYSTSAAVFALVPVVASIAA